MKRITQRELSEYRRLANLEKRREELRADILKRLTAGAAVECGRLSASVEVRTAQRLTWPGIAELLGPADVARLRERVPHAEQRCLKVGEADG